MNVNKFSLNECIISIYFQYQFYIENVRFLKINIFIQMTQDFRKNLNESTIFFEYLGDEEDETVGDSYKESSGTLMEVAGEGEIKIEIDTEGNTDTENGEEILITKRMFYKLL